MRDYASKNDEYIAGGRVHEVEDQDARSTPRGCRAPAREGSQQQKPDRRAAADRVDSVCHTLARHQLHESFDVSSSRRLPQFMPCLHMVVHTPSALRAYLLSALPKNSYSREDAMRCVPEEGPCRLQALLPDAPHRSRARSTLVAEKTPMISFPDTAP